MTTPPVILDARVIAGAGGGPDKTILNTPRFLEPAGYRMLCAYLRPPGDPGFEAIRRKAAALHAPLVEIDDTGPLDWRVVPRLLEVCRRERVTVWHGHDYKTNALGLVLKRFWPMRLATTVHGWVHRTRRTPLYYLIDRLTLRHYELVIAVSPDLYGLCRTAGVPRRRCVLLENGIDLDDFARRHSVEEAKRRLGLPADRPLVGAAGRLSAEKGFLHLIRAADRLVREGLDLGLVILGEGDQHAELESTIAALGRGDRFRLAGFQADPRGWFEAMDVFALSSLREGLPNVLLEALALEVPTVATRIAGVPRLLRDRANGLLVEPGDEASLAATLRELLGDASLRERLARAGRQTVEAGYSFRRRIDRLQTLYEVLLGRNTRPPNRY